MLRLTCFRSQSNSYLRIYWNSGRTAVHSSTHDTFVGITGEDIVWFIRMYVNFHLNFFLSKRYSYISWHLNKSSRLDDAMLLRIPLVPFEDEIKYVLKFMNENSDANSRHKSCEDFRRFLPANMFPISLGNFHGTSQKILSNIENCQVKDRNLHFNWNYEDDWRVFLSSSSSFGIWHTRQPTATCKDNLFFRSQIGIAIRRVPFQLKLFAFDANKKRKVVQTISAV